MQAYKQGNEIGPLPDPVCYVKTQNGINVDRSVLPLTTLPNLQKRWTLAAADELISLGESTFGVYTLDPTRKPPEIESHAEGMVTLGPDALDNPEEEEKLQRISAAVKTMIECLGESPEREGLRKTPLRYAKAMLHFTKGYEENLDNIVNGALFKDDDNKLVIVRDIEISSLCEHHLIPFSGKVIRIALSMFPQANSHTPKIHIGYISNGWILGLSKLPRIAEMFARRLQVQERITTQTALALQQVLKPVGVAVVMESLHLCMAMRGVQKPTATTITSCLKGIFQEDQAAREEFFMLLNRR
jgi:GTP cyclohydrolase I